MNVSAGAAWRSTGLPLFYAGAHFYRAGSTVFFDGHVMRQAGSDNGIVFYSDVTQEPFSVIYVPVGGGLMQPYERTRAGELAGTTGSRTPSFPIEFDVESRHDAAMARIARDNDEARADRLLRRGRASRRTVSTAATPSAVSTSASVDAFKAVGAITIAPPNRDDMRAGRLLDNRDLPNAPGNTSLWVEFDDARWFNAGPAVVLDSQRFERAGELEGFAVYRERGGAADRIFVSVTLGGLVAPYRRR